MQKTVSAVPMAFSFAALMALGALAGTTPAAADPAQDKVISTFCNNQLDAPDCNDWRYNRGSWSAAKYQSFYAAHDSDPAFQSAVTQAAGLPVNTTASTKDVDPGTAPERDPLGTAPYAVTIKNANSPTGVGEVVSTPTGNVVKTMPEVIGDSPTHVADCQATFKSYDPATDTYMGLDGSRQKCKL